MCANPCIGHRAGARVAEEENAVESGPQNIGARVDPAAEEMALASASRREADAFLRAQRGLIEDQRHHLHEQLKQLSLGLWEKRIGMMLRLAMLAVGLGVIIGLGMALWNAAHADGLVIEGLSAAALCPGRHYRRSVGRRSDESGC